jgi:RNA polymerase sigma-70 factor (ECF subfamily)
MAEMRKTPGTTWNDDQVLALVSLHERLVCSYLRYLGCPPDRVEDLAQETFLRLFCSPARDRSPGELRGYLCAAARNLLLNSHRADAARPKLEPLDRAWIEFERADGGSAYLDALRGCLEGLPPPTREVLRLRFGSDMPRAAIAARVQSSLGGVKSLLLRSKEQLRGCIRRKLGLDLLDSVEATP